MSGNLKQSISEMVKPLPWVKSVRGGGFEATLGPYYYRIDHFSGPFEKHDESGKIIRDDNGKPVMEELDHWMSWPCGALYGSVGEIRCKTIEGAKAKIADLHRRRVLSLLNFSKQ